MEQQLNQNQAQINYSGLAKQDAEELVNIEGKMVDVLLQRADQMANNADWIKAYLAGFGEVLGTVRKSEAKAVFEAYAVSREKTEHAAETLGNTYHKFVTQCREIRGKKQRAPKKAGKVTDKGMADIENKVGVMSAEQLQGIISKAIEHLAHDFDGDVALALFLTIENTAVLGAEVSKDEKHQKLFSDIAEMAEKPNADAAAERAKEKAAENEKKAREAEKTIDGEYHEVKGDTENDAPLPLPIAA